MARANPRRQRVSTIGHSPRDLGIEAGLIKELDYTVPETYASVTNLVGNPRLRIDVGYPFSLAARDTLLLASDGLSDNLTPGELREIMKEDSLTQVARKLLLTSSENMRQARTHGPSKPDDLTYILFRR